MFSWRKANLTVEVEIHYRRASQACVLALEVLLPTVFFNHPCTALVLQLVLFQYGQHLKIISRDNSCRMASRFIEQTFLAPLVHGVPGFAGS